MKRIELNSPRNGGVGGTKKSKYGRLEDVEADPASFKSSTKTTSSSSTGTPLRGADGDDSLCHRVFFCCCSGVAAGSSASSLRAMSPTERSLATVGVVNLCYVVLQLGVATQTGSLAMMSDAFHNLSDVGAAAVAFWCERLHDRRTAFDAERLPFGYLRLQVLGACVNAVCLVSLAAYLVLAALPQLLTPKGGGFRPTWTFLGVALCGVALNLGSALLLCCGGKDDQGRPAFVHAHLGCSCPEDHGSGGGGGGGGSGIGSGSSGSAIGEEGRAGSGFGAGPAGMGQGNGDLGGGEGAVCVDACCAPAPPDAAAMQVPFGFVNGGRKRPKRRVPHGLPAVPPPPPPPEPSSPATRDVEHGGGGGDGGGQGGALSGSGGGSANGGNDSGGSGAGNGGRSGTYRSVEDRGEGGGSRERAGGKAAESSPDTSAGRAQQPSKLPPLPSEGGGGGGGGGEGGPHPPDGQGGQEEGGGLFREWRRMLAGMDANVLAVAVHSAGDAASALAVLLIGGVVLGIGPPVPGTGVDGGGGGFSWLNLLDPAVTIVLSLAMAAAVKPVLVKGAGVLLEASALSPAERRALQRALEEDQRLAAMLAAAAGGGDDEGGRGGGGGPPAVEVRTLVVTDLDFTGTTRRAHLVLAPRFAAKAPLLEPPAAATAAAAASSRSSLTAPSTTALSIATSTAASTAILAEEDGGGQSPPGESASVEGVPLVTRNGGGKLIAAHAAVRRRAKWHLQAHGVQWASVEIQGQGTADDGGIFRIRVIGA